jgi:hypothetical protein
MPKEIEFFQSTTRDGYPSVVGKIKKKTGKPKVLKRSTSPEKTPSSSRKTPRTPSTIRPHNAYSPGFDDIPGFEGMLFNDGDKQKMSQGDVR